MKKSEIKSEIISMIEECRINIKNYACSVDEINDRFSGRIVFNHARKEKIYKLGQMMVEKFNIPFGHLNLYNKNILSFSFDK